MGHGLASITIALESITLRWRLPLQPNQQHINYRMAKFGKTFPRKALQNEGRKSKVTKELCPQNDYDHILCAISRELLFFFLAIEVECDSFVGTKYRIIIFAFYFFIYFFSLGFLLLRKLLRIDFKFWDLINYSVSNSPPIIRLKSPPNKR